MLHNFSQMLRDEDGQGLVEYALIIALVSIVAIVGLQYLGKSTNNTLNNAASAIDTNGGGGADAAPAKLRVAQ